MRKGDKMLCDDHSNPSNTPITFSKIGAVVCWIEPSGPRYLGFL